jgi:NAD(P)H-hydrate epimerase
VREINREDLKKLYKPPKDSHKGQNGKLTIIGGSQLFHGASLWALKIASRIVDMVYYSSILENNKIAEKLKSEIYDFICVPRGEVESYIKESDAVLMGPGMTRDEETKKTTQRLLSAFPNKKWILDAGSLQMMEADWLKKLSRVIITPHKKEFISLFGSEFETKDLGTLAKEYGCVIVLKGPIDYICSPAKCVRNPTGNEGMTKGGTGDVLAGLIAALACKNELFLSAGAGVYINGLAGDQLYKKVGPFYNASDLCDEVPKILK